MTTKTPRPLPARDAHEARVLRLVLGRPAVRFDPEAARRLIAERRAEIKSHAAKESR